MDDQPGSPRTPRLWDLLVPGLLLAVAAVFFAGAFAIEDYGTDVVPPQAFPLALSATLGVSALAYLVGAVRSHRRWRLALDPDEQRAAVTAVILAGVGLAMPVAGFYPAVGLGLFAMLVIARVARLPWIVLTVACILGFIFVVFDWLLSVPLPTGPF